jgi:hypothetical protein
VRLLCQSFEIFFDDVVRHTIVGLPAFASINTE